MPKGLSLRRHQNLEEASKKALMGGGVLGSVETEVNSLRRSISYEEGVHPSIALKCGPPVVDLVGIDPELLASS
jgi:hypothetical protein